MAALAHQPVPFRFAATSADVVFVTPFDDDEVVARVTDIRQAEADVGRTGPPLVLFADLVTYLAATHDDAVARKAHLDDQAGFEHRSDAVSFAGTVTELADTIEAWRAFGVAGFRLRPGVIERDLPTIVDELVPELQRRGVFRSAYEPGTLRQRLGLARPVSRYASAGTDGGRA